MLILNRHPDHGAALDTADAEALGDAGASAAAGYFTARADYRPTPLWGLPALAGALGVGAVQIKDEGQRLGLGSFKALGGAYALARLALEQAERTLGGPLGEDALQRPEVREIAGQMTFACATAGNHGRSVAWGAREIGARAVIFVPGGVAEARVAAMARFGAEMIRTESPYDDAVALAAEIAEARGWVLVSDTGWPGYERIPGLVMQGYGLIAQEALEALDAPPTHLFVQAGIGGLAASLAARLALTLGPQRPKVVVVEPEHAACLFESARAGRLIRLPPGEPTTMAMLACQQPSLNAWRVLSRLADAFMTVSDADAAAAVRRLANPAPADRALVAGDSGAAGLAGLMRVAGDAEARACIGLDANSRVLLVNSETANDAARFRDLVGRDPAEVAPAAVEAEGAEA